MIDIGVHRFLEMIEERFGKFVSSSVIAIVGIAVVVFCVQHIITDAIVPAWQVADLIKTNPKSAAAIVYDFVSIIGTLITWAIVVPVSLVMIFRAYRNRHEWKKLLKEMDDQMETVKKYNTSIQKFTDEIKALPGGEQPLPAIEILRVLEKYFKNVETLSKPPDKP